MTDLTFHLTKERGQSLGIGFRKLVKPPHCEISVLVENGVAAASGLIRPGDILLSINGVDVQHLSPNEVVGVMQESDDSAITLQVRRQVANGNMNLSATDVGSPRGAGSLTPDIDNNMDMDSSSDIDDPPDALARMNSHPKIIVHPNSPPVSPDCVSPIVDVPVPETSAEGWKGEPQQKSGRARRTGMNPMTRCGGMPEIPEAASDGKESLTANNLNVLPAGSHRHSLTPEAVRKPMEDLKRANLRSSKSLDLANLPQWRRGKTSHSITMHNLLDGTEMSDRLHTQGIKVCS